MEDTHHNTIVKCIQSFIIIIKSLNNPIFRNLRTFDCTNRFLQLQGEELQHSTQNRTNGYRNWMIEQKENDYLQVGRDRWEAGRGRKAKQKQQ